MAAYRRVDDSRHLQADCQELISSGTLRSVIECGLLLPFLALLTILTLTIGVILHLHLPIIKRIQTATVK